MKELKHFVKIDVGVKTIKKDGVKMEVACVYPTYKLSGNDIMKKGGDFYAIYDSSTGFWSTDAGDIYRIIDRDIRDYISEHFSRDAFGHWITPDGRLVYAEFLDDSSTGSMLEFNKWFNNIQNKNHNYVQLDTELTFKSTKVDMQMYRSMRLDYDIAEGPIPFYDKLMSTLYDEENRQKLEWAIGAVLSGDSKSIDKMIVIYGRPGKGKGTVLKIIESLFEGYWSAFNADELASGSNQFATAAFKDNPLVAIQEDGTLKRIESPIINQIVSHETTLVNEKSKRQYPIRPNAMLFVATNDVVDLRDTKIGMTRRLIDVYPSMKTLDGEEYFRVTEGLKFEYGAIAYHCLKVYKTLGRLYFSKYRPTDMIRKSNLLLNFFDTNLEEFSKQEIFTCGTLYNQFKEYCKDQGYDYTPKRLTFDENVKEYFDEYYQRKRIGDQQYRCVLVGLKIDKILGITPKEEPKPAGTWIDLKQQESVLDGLYSEQPAQYASEKTGKPVLKWCDVKTKLKELDTHKLHWFLLPNNVIKIDFDKRGADGKKDLAENIKAASVFPPTYCEVSQSGGGLHLYYIYTGDVNELSHLYADNVEIKVSSGNNSHRRALSLCNNLPVATLSDGLPQKEVKSKVVDETVVTTERGLRSTIKQCLAKKIHADTTSNIHFIDHILKKAYESGVKYDVSDMYTEIYMFAAGSTNQSEHCLNVVRDMKLASEEKEDGFVVGDREPKHEEEGPIIFYDIEVFPNLMILCWMYDQDGAPVNVMINPTADELTSLFGFGKAIKPRTIGFNNRGYDDHIVYGRIVGDSILSCYNRSQRIINGDSETSKAAKFAEGYNLSYADVYDFSSDKMSLKKWEIKLGIHHQELGLDWDKPVPEEMWNTVGEYCKNDVLATRAVFHACEGDYITRQALADISGLKVINTNRQHITKILLGDDKKADHIYTDLATGVAYDSSGMPVPLDPNVINEFPGYEYRQDEKGKWINWYRGTDVGRGGYVYAEPGMYKNVALLDVGNMHGASIDKLNKFGRHTERYRTIRNARMAIKHRDYILASKLLDGKLDKYLTSDEMASRIEKALKLVLNSTYGIAAATFKNPLKDERDKNNIIALRGALFMRTLQDEVQAKGFKVIHIKTDSIKIPDATPEIIQFVTDFGKKYGYEFEHEATYERICLVNDAVYIAKYDEQGIRNKGGKHAGEWTATGAEFQHPYIFKTLFSKEPIIFEDKCETKSCASALVLDFNEDLPENEHDYRFVGKVGSFCPIKPGCGGGILYRKQDEKYYAATGTTGYRWMEAEVVKATGREFILDESYYRKLIDNAIEHISEFGDFEWFVHGNVEFEEYDFNVA